MKDRLIVLDAREPEAERIYQELRAAGAVLAVHGEAPWAADADRVSLPMATLIGIYADEVIGGGLPAALVP